MKDVRAKPALLALFFSCSALLISSLLVPFMANLHFLHLPLYAITLSAAALVLIFLYLSALNKGFITPVGLFILSLLVFILARPYLYFFIDIDIIETGNKIDFFNILNTIAHVSAGLAFIGFGYMLFKPEKLRIRYLLFKEIRINKIITIILLLMSIVLIFIFMKKSYSNFLVLKDINYEAALELGTFHSHLIYFILAKQLMLLWVFFSSNKNKFLVGSLVLFVGSIGFILIGLRGYAIAYLFLLLYFINERKKISPFLLLIISFGLVYTAALVLEFRIGFKIFANIWEVIPKTLYQQGASFEVVFGAVVFSDELKSCISIIEYFQGKDFGLCVDRARGVDWEYGGFASSFFAETIYFGYIPYICICAMLGFGIKYLDFLSKIRKDALKKGVGSQFIGLVLFATIPNLVYFARSSAFDFIIKVLTISLILMLFAALFSKGFKSENS